MDILVLAGGKCSPSLKLESGQEFRADVPFFGKSSLDLMLEVVEGLGNVIVVGGPPGRHENQVPGGSHFIGSVQAGLAQVTSENFLLVTVDIPFVRRAHIERYLGKCDESAGINYPIIPVEECEKQFPGLKRTTLALREGRFTGGNLALMKRSLMQTALPILAQAYEKRKDPLSLARLVGFDTLVRVMLGKIAPATLSIATLESKVSRFLEVPVKGIITLDAALGTDIDDGEQFLAALALQVSAYSADS
ncbi:MAG: NTP transferase domain-containing protein [Fimbriimonadaceae bacterium]|jgi:hypothetical protein|nr:NTP transferase domain-containing protein [Fimbriimonadaceae bacterium]